MPHSFHIQSRYPRQTLFYQRDVFHYSSLQQLPLFKERKKNVNIKLVKTYKYGNRILSDFIALYFDDKG